MKSTARDMADSLEMWGVRKVYRLGFGVQATKPDEVPARIMERIHRETDQVAGKIQKNAGKSGYNGRAKKWFYLMRFAHKHFPPSEPDYGYWEKQGWHGWSRPWGTDSKDGGSSI